MISILSGLLHKLVRSGRLVLIDGTGKRRIFGNGGAPTVTVRLHERALHRKLLFNPALSLGEAYMEGALTLEEGSLDELLHICTLNMEALANHPLQRVRGTLDGLGKWLQHYNPIRRSRANVAHHYDLSDELYALFLDVDRQYSCAYFPTGTESLERAQELKKAHIAAKLLLRPGLKVLDIGCGWGGLGLYLAQVAQVDVTGITLSREQLKVASGRAVATGLVSRMHFHLRDYREEQGRYDRIASVGMFEHVGPPHYGEFFRKLRDLLKPDGVALLHSIGRLAGPGTTNEWIRKYVFPGGYAPALSEVLPAVERSGLYVTDIEILRLDYAETLREWSRRFAKHRERIKRVYDERFCRMWEFYLAASESAFRNQDQMVFQMQLARRKDAVPRARDYIGEWERRHMSGSIRAA